MAPMCRNNCAHKSGQRNCGRKCGSAAWWLESMLLCFDISPPLAINRSVTKRLFTLLLLFLSSELLISVRKKYKKQIKQFESFLCAVISFALIQALAHKQALNLYSWKEKWQFQIIQLVNKRKWNTWLLTSRQEKSVDSNNFTYFLMKKKNNNTRAFDCLIPSAAKALSLLTGEKMFTFSFYPLKSRSKHTLHFKMVVEWNLQWVLNEIFNQVLNWNGSSF